MIERHQIIEAMTELKLYGMRASFDEVVGKGLARREDLYPLLASLIRAEVTHRQSQSINYRIGGAKFPMLKGLEDFVFSDTPSRKAWCASWPAATSSRPSATSSSSAARARARPTWPSPSPPR